MAIKIDSKIVDYSVQTAEEKRQADEKAAQAAAERKASNIVHMHESVERPDMLIGSTYKIKTPDSEHAMYITINDIVLNEGTEHEQRRPFEIFINSKNMEHFQWILALTRITSAVFRKGGDVTFLVEEMQAVFDPRGGYWKKGGRFIPSLIAEIGDVIHDHLVKIGMIKVEGLSAAQQQILDEKRAAFEAGQKVLESSSDTNEGNPYPPGASLCKKCHTQAAIMMDGCLTCLNCGDSKCG